MFRLRPSTHPLPPAVPPCPAKPPPRSPRPPRSRTSGPAPGGDDEMAGFDAIITETNDVAPFAEERALYYGCCLPQAAVGDWNHAAAKQPEFVSLTLPLTLCEVDWCLAAGMIKKRQRNRPKSSCIRS
ncbi:uncharacterized protein [Triticum aestivum]|uniref:uncharacterized protein isoform X2 n=1 Tax=Triticum aestivum TaxID=4565 RepID=UPI001D0074CD|nr:uncharacterized protein LOC123083201 isoform X2 [Triticum aestivum]